jgi:hypothetical protein
MKKIHFNVTPVDTNNNSLRSKNSEGGIPTYNENEILDDISGKDITEQTRPKLSSKTGFGRSKDSKELTKVEVFDGGQFISADTNQTKNRIGKDLELPLNGDDMVKKISQQKYAANLHSKKGDKYNLNKSEENTIEKVSDGEDSDSSKLGKILFDDTTETNKIESSKLESRAPQSEGNNDWISRESNTSSETRNAYNIRPFIHSTEESQRKDNTGIEEIQGKTIQSSVNKHESELWGRNEQGDTIPRADENVIENAKEDRQVLVERKNESDMQGEKESETKIRKWSEGKLHSDSGDKVILDTGGNAKLLNRNEDAISKPNHHSSKLGSRAPQSQGNDGGKKSKNNMSEINTSSEARNSYNIHPWALNGTEESQRKNNTGIEEIQGSTTQSPVNKHESKLWGRNEQGDTIPRADENVIENAKEDRQELMENKNKGDMQGDKESGTKMRQWVMGNQHSNSVDQVVLDTGGNAKLLNRNEDAIPKPNQDWLSEDEMDDTVSKPDQHLRFANQEPENEMDEKDENSRNRKRPEEISDGDEDIPKEKGSWMSIDDIEDSNSNPDSNIGEKINKNEGTDTQFEDHGSEFERNQIPTSNTDRQRIYKENKNKNGMFI